MNASLSYRPLNPRDYDALKAIHARLFPIDYEDIFFTKSVNSQDRVFSYAAIACIGGEEELVGFVTARQVWMHECDPVDRHHLGVWGPLHDMVSAVYILTLGVSEGWRQCGIASTLLQHVRQHALQLRCSFVFLHVIAYNDPAMRLYTRNSYQCLTRLHNFYTINSGRQPDPTRQNYDAYLFALHLEQPLAPAYSRGPGAHAVGWGGMVSLLPFANGFGASLGHLGQGVVNAAVAPLRHALGTVNACFPALPAWWPGSHGPAHHPAVLRGDVAQASTLHQQPTLLAPPPRPTHRSQSEEQLLSCHSEVGKQEHPQGVGQQTHHHQQPWDSAGRWQGSNADPGGYAGQGCHSAPPGYGASSSSSGSKWHPPGAVEYLPSGNRGLASSVGSARQPHHQGLAEGVSSSLHANNSSTKHTSQAPSLFQQWSSPPNGSARTAR